MTLVALILTALLRFFPSVAHEETITLRELTTLYANAQHEIYVINFWASWCGPCVKELPAFEQLGGQDGVEMIFVSLDFEQDFDKAQKILIKKGVLSKNYFLDEKDPDKLIRTIDESWSGAIPATLFIHESGRKIFHEGELESPEINSIIENLILNK